MIKMEEPYSHARPKKLLKEHLKNVADYSKKKINELNLNLKIVDKNSLAELSYLLGAFHDIGKIDSSFQIFIKEVEKRGESRLEHNDHAEVSANIFRVALKTYLDRREIPNGLKAVLILSLPHLIHKHHGSLADALDYNNSNEGMVREQLNELSGKKEQLSDILDHLKVEEYEIDPNVLSEQIKPEILDIKERFNLQKEAISWLSSIPEEDRIELFLILELLYSNLVDYDKKDAARIIKLETKMLEFPDDLVDKYKEQKKKNEQETWGPSEDNTAKEEFYSGVVNNQNLNPKNKLYTITAPTGAGKTLAALSAAIRLRNKIKKETGKEYRIIYVLPYTSIIDQNYEEFRNAMKNSFGNDFEQNEPDYLVKHHHPAEPKERRILHERYVPNYLAEVLWNSSWESNIIVSTYIQLLHSLMGYHGSFLNKFHNIANSIVILDEVQFVSSKYWNLLKKMISVFSERFSTYFILMTATQPNILDAPVELASKKPEIWKRPKVRVSNNNQMNLEDFKKFFVKYLEENKCDKVLVILNTIKSSIEFYKFLKKLNLSGFDLYYLSTNIVYYDRKKRIEELVKLRKNKTKKYICVTTQVIEAGVDITSDCCFRDAAPLDCIVQSAGRCNRFRELGDALGDFHLVTLSSGEHAFYKWVYDQELVQRAMKNLENVQDSTGFEKAMEKYFDELRNYEHSDELTESIKTLRFDGVKEFFHPIEENEGYKVPVYFVHPNGEAKSILEKYFTVFNDEKTEKFKKLGELKRIRTKMQKYFVDVKKDIYFEMKNRGYISEKNGIEYVGGEYYKKVYDEDTGIVLSFDDSALFM